MNILMHKFSTIYTQIYAYNFLQYIYIYIHTDSKYFILPNITEDCDGTIDLANSCSSHIFPEVKQAVSCSDIVKDAHIESTAIDFVPNIQSGSYADIGARDSMDDEHVCIDDLSTHLRSMFKCPMPSGFYAVFDGHGGPHAASFVKRNAMRLFFEDADWLKMLDIDSISMKDLVNSHRKSFLLADLALADEQSVGSSCGTTALTALVLGSHLLVANAGDCRAVLCRKGVAVPMSQDHRPSNLLELERVEGMGGFVDDGYVNGNIAVTRTLGDWDLKLPNGSSSPLIAEPQVEHVVLTKDDEFLILGCDGIWDVMSSQYAVSLVRRGLRKHNDPDQSSRELVHEALRLNTSDNLTAVVICFSSPSCMPQQRIWKPCSLTEEARNKLRNLLEGN